MQVWLKCKLHSCNGQKMVYHNVNWPKKIGIPPLRYLEAHKENYHGFKESIRCLRRCAEHNNDPIQAKIFASYELEAYYKSLPSFNLPLWASKWSNGFGRYWGQPLFWLFGFSLILYLLIVIVASRDVDDVLNFLAGGTYFNLFYQHTA